MCVVQSHVCVLCMCVCTELLMLYTEPCMCLYRAVYVFYTEPCMCVWHRACNCVCTVSVSCTEPGVRVNNCPVYKVQSRVVIIEGFVQNSGMVPSICYVKGT